MTDLQRADLEAGQRGVEYNVLRATALGTIVDDDLPNIIADIAVQVGNVEKAELAQQHDSGDVADEKELIKQIMTDTVLRFALRGEVKAERLGLLLLSESLHHTDSFIMRADSVLSVARANDIKNTIAANVGAGKPLTNITAGDITLMTDKIKDYDEIKNEPTNLIKVKKSDGTDLIQPEVNILNGLIDQERKLLHSYWDGTANAKLVDEFELKTHPIVLGKRHNIVAVTILRDEDGKELKGAEVTSIKNGKKSDGNGTNVYVIEGIQAGTKPFKAEAPGRETVEFDVRVKVRETVEVIIRMKLI